MQQAGRGDSLSNSRFEYGNGTRCSSTLILPAYCLLPPSSFVVNFNHAKLFGAVLRSRTRSEEPLGSHLSLVPSPAKYLKAFKFPTFSTPKPGHLITDRNGNS
jgi:hypothetical protein